MDKRVSLLNTPCQAYLPGFAGKIAYMQTIGDRIKSRREHLGMTQQQLADFVGVTRSSVSQWEGGSTKNLKVENLVRCADKLKTNIRWLVFGAGDENATEMSARGDVASPAIKGPEQNYGGMPKPTDEEQVWLALMRELTPDQRDSLFSVAGQFAASKPERRIYPHGSGERKKYYSPLMSDPAFGPPTKSIFKRFDNKAGKNHKENDQGEGSGTEKNK